MSIRDQAETEALRQIHGQPATRMYSVAAVKQIVYPILNALASRKPEAAPSAHSCETCVDCLHDGAKCCGCYDGVCCRGAAPSDTDLRIPLYAMLDVWSALYGTSHPEFDAFYAEHGYAETWARLLAAVRSQPVQVEVTDDKVIAAIAAYFETPGNDDMTRMRSALSAALGGGDQ